MGKASPIQTAFNSGELSPKLEGRVDLAKYSNGAKLVENFLLSVQGPAIRRGGTRFVSEVKTSFDGVNAANRTAWLLRFEYNTTQAYVLEFGDFYIRFYSLHGQVTTSGVAAYNALTAYIIGDLVTQGGITYYCLAPTTGNAPPNATYWYAQTGSIYEIPTPYPYAKLTDTDGTLRLRFAQSGDIIYITHPEFQPGKLSRFGPQTWTFTQVANTGGPFKTLNADSSSTVYASAATGTVTLTASKPIFSAALVGSLFYLQQQDINAVSQWTSATSYAAAASVRSSGVNYTTAAGGTSGGTKPTHSYGTAQDGNPGVAWAYNDPGYGVVQITGFTDSTHVTATVMTTLPTGAVGVANASQRWALGAWSAVEGYPSQVTFFRERLVFAANQSVWFSVTGDYENFAGKDLLGQVAADGAITITIVARKVNKVQWLDPGTDLLIGTAGGEFRCREMTNNQVFGPGNVTVQPQSEYGSKSIAPQRIGASVVYVQRSGRKVREMAYDFGPDSYKSTDVTVLSEHVTKAVANSTFAGLLTSDYQQEPYSVLWYARGDGALLGLTFNREQDVVGWHRHPIGGSGIVEAVTCIPSPDGGRNELWLIVRRTINGATKRYIEYMDVEHQDGDDIEQAFYVDAGLTYDGKVAQTLQPGAGATVAHTTGVNFAAGGAVFAPTDVGRSIHYRYLASNTNAAGVITYTWMSGKALITAYVDAQNVTCTIDAAFPNLTLIAASAWRMTVTSITGLSHLEGMTVDVLNTGASHPQQTVTGGTITLQYPGSVVAIGLPCPARMWTMRLNAGAQDGTSQGKTARINKLAVRFQESVGCQYGADPTVVLDTLPFRSTGDAMDQPPPLFSGDKVVEFDGDYTLEPRVFLQNNQPFPTTIVAVMPQTHVYDR